MTATTPRRWNPVDSWSGGLLEVALGRYYTRASAYAAAARVRYISQGPLRYTSIDHDLPKISIQSSLESPKNRRLRRRRLPDPRPISEGVREPIYMRKK